MSKSIEIEGIDELMKRLSALGDAGRRNAERAVNEMSQQVRTTAIRSISRGQSRGRTYELYGPRRTHTASAPGDAPNTDTGRLSGSIKAIVKGANGRVGTDVQYGLYLELGTQNMTERPWLWPALESNRDFFRDRMEKAVQRAIDESSR